MPRIYVVDTGEKATRRSFWTFGKRGMLPAHMSSLTAPMCLVYGRAAVDDLAASDREDSGY